MSHLNPSPASKLKTPGPISAPSPTPSNSSASGVKRRKDAPSSTPFSQPADTGTGTALITQVFYAQEYLKDKDRELSFEEIWDYLSINDSSGTTMAMFRNILQSGKAQIEYDPEGNHGRGSYRYKTPHNVRDEEQLKNYLHRQPTMQGILVKELKDGWRGAAKAVDDLESSHDILVTRSKKNFEARVVWADDPNLHSDIDAKFRSAWLSVPLPANPDDIRAKLQSKGIKPTTEKKVVKISNQPRDKKRKGPRKGGRQTNTHMTHMLKDYSHLRK